MFRVPSSTKYTSSAAVTQQDVIPARKTPGINESNGLLYNSNKKSMQLKDDFQISTKKKDGAISNST